MTDKKKKSDNVVDLAEERERREKLENLKKTMKDSERVWRMFAGLGLFLQAALEPHMEEIAKAAKAKPPPKKPRRRRKKK